MGFSPRAVDDLSLWQFRAAAAGWAEANGAETSGPMSEAEFAAAEAALDAAPETTS